MKTPLNTSDNKVQQLFREASLEQTSYTELHTKRDLLRAADASLLTRIHLNFSHNTGKYLMTIGAALAAVGLSTILLQNPTPVAPATLFPHPQAVPKTLALGPSVQTHAVKSGCSTTSTAPEAVKVAGVDTTSKNPSTSTSMTIVRAGSFLKQSADNGGLSTDSSISGKLVLGEPIGCDAMKWKPNSVATGTRLIGTGIASKRKALPPIDLNSRNALVADTFLTALGIVKSANKVMFYDGSSINNPSLRYLRYLSATEDDIHIDAEGGNMKTVDPAYNAKVPFRPMFIVRADGSVLEFCDVAVNSSGKVNADPVRMALYKDSCVTVVVHPDGVKPFYLLYYPTPEFLNALPRERALQVRAEQGNAEALRELQDSYRGCRYMSFCSTSNGAIEDTEILGSLSSDTRVRITLKETRMMRVALYDIAGRVVAEIEKGGSYTPGQHVIPLQVQNANQHAPTFYLLCITTDAGEKVSQRVVLGN